MTDGSFGGEDARAMRLGVTAGDRSRLFKKAYFLAGHRSVLRPDQVRSIYDRFWETLSVPGDFVECGAYRGGLSFFVAVLVKELGLRKRVHLFEGFQGLPRTRKVDGCFKQGQYRAAYRETLEFSARHGLDGIVTIWPGWFHETLPKLPARTRFSMAHLDADLYASTRLALEHVYPRMRRSGVIVFDDFFHPRSRGVSAAAHELLGKQAPYVAGPAGQAYLVV